ncbi:hypothetical protein ZIOFF_048533 [Zingiber officinale]|uniref:Serine aminopeptidase S33 domain-containing protein n=1 Tax=Zingiber officinale TaxID=94328 RepID=A0A8J5FQS0_ZINOF|nr:hypothetical protein ZIOFF_048533 [Zingiber officinale]
MVSEANLDDAPDRRRIRDAFKEVELGIDHCLIKAQSDGLKTEEVCGVARKLASSDFGVFAMDYPGFGLSEGLHGYIPSFDTLVNDSLLVVWVAEKPEYHGLPNFFLGDEMGGAVALKAHFKQASFLERCNFSSTNVQDNVVPQWPVKQFLIGMAKLLPERKLVPHKDIGEMAFRDPKKLQQVRLKLSESSKRIS